MGGQSGGGATPGHLSAYTKMLLDWIDPVEITNDGVYRLRASELHNDYFMISGPYDDGEFMLIENRQPLLFDDGFFGGGGIVIYRVDSNTGVIGNRNRGGPFQQGWPRNGNGFTLSVLQADGEYDLEQGLNNGDAGDLWRPGQSLGPGNGEQVANSANYPNTDGYTNGVKVTGLTIDSFTEVESGVWSFRVSGLGGGNPTNPPQTSAPNQSPVSVPDDQSPISSPNQSPTNAPPTEDDPSGAYPRQIPVVSSMILSGAFVAQAIGLVA